MRKSYIGWTWLDWQNRFKPTDNRIDQPVIIVSYRKAKQLVGKKVKVRITIEEV